MNQNLKINKYSFGKMVIGEKTFTSDLIIFPNGTIQENWWRAKGHNLIPDDISNVLKIKPEKLIVGTGAYGLMRVSEKVTETCKGKGIEILAHKTAKAVQLYNDQSEDESSIAACFHLTC